MRQLPFSTARMLCVCAPFETRERHILFWTVQTRSRRRRNAVCTESNRNSWRFYPLVCAKSTDGWKWTYFVVLFGASGLVGSFGFLNPFAIDCEPENPRTRPGVRWEPPLRRNRLAPLSAKLAELDIILRNTEVLKLSDWLLVETEPNVINLFSS